MRRDGNLAEICGRRARLLREVDGEPDEGARRVGGGVSASLARRGENGRAERARVGLLVRGFGPSWTERSRPRLREKGAGRTGPRGKGGPDGLELLGWVWVSYWVSIFLFFSILFLKQTNMFESKYKFELKPHSLN